MQQTYHIEAVSNGFVVALTRGEGLTAQTDKYIFVTFTQLSEFVAKQLRQLTP